MRPAGVHHRGPRVQLVHALGALALAASCSGRASSPGSSGSASPPTSQATDAPAPVSNGPSAGIDGQSARPPAEPDSAAGPESPAEPDDCLPPEDDAVDGILGSVNNIFRVHCVRCHGTEPWAGTAALPQFDGLGDAVTRGLIDACAPDDSPLLIALRSGSMPPPDEILQPSDRDLAQVEQGLPYLCGPQNWLGCKELPRYPGCGVTHTEGVLRGSCGRCHDGDEVDAGGLLGTAQASDVRALIENGYLVPCNAEASPLLATLRAGPVAPHQACVRFPPDYEIDRIARFADGLCNVWPTNLAARDAAPMLAERCGGCHSASAAAGQRPAGETWDVQDLESLTRLGLVMPCAPNRSPLVARMRDGSMPPANVAAPASDEEIALVVRFAESFCDEGPAPP